MKFPPPKANQAEPMAGIPESELILNPDGSVYHLNLLPEHIADTIIVVGDPGRVSQVSSHFDSVEFEMNKREFITHTGYLRGKRLTVISSGIGTDNVEILLNELDALANIDLLSREVKSQLKSLTIIRIGTSGAIQEAIEPGSFVVSEYAVGLDTLGAFYPFTMAAGDAALAKRIQQYLGLPFSPYIGKGSKTLIEQLGFDMVKGNTVTSPGFYAPQGRSLRLPITHAGLVTKLMYFDEPDFWLTNFEMETAAYYALGGMMGHQIVSFNAIIANRATHRFAENPSDIVEGLIKTVLARL